MLADCAAKPASCSHNDFAQVLSERMSAVADELHESQLGDSEGPPSDKDSGWQPGDHELMAALANCCGGQNPFSSGDDGLSTSDDLHVLKSADGASARPSEQSQAGSGSLARDACEDSSLCHWLYEDGPDILWQHC